MRSNEKTGMHTRVWNFLSKKMSAMGMLRNYSSCPPVRTKSKMSASCEPQPERVHCALALLQSGLYSKHARYEIFDAEEGAALSLAPRTLFDVPLPERTSAECVLVSSKNYAEKQGKLFPHLSRSTQEHDAVFAKKYVESRRDARLSVSSLGRGDRVWDREWERGWEREGV